MTKTNSLKLVPYGTRTRYDRETQTQIPYRVLLEYTYGAPGEASTEWGHPIEWRPNEPFEASLELDRLERGRSAARFWFVNQGDGTEYPFFGQGLVDMLSQVTLEHGMVRGTWIAVKRGANYGLELAEVAQ
ncbi:MAG: hypothetical protein K0Q52_138 [Microbacterium sp.]|jgi:hypothetical protein|nr:hypothetical protein [Microbacterium sp.]